MKFTAPALLLLAGSASAQIQKAVAAGDVTTVGTVTTINNLTVGVGGAWVVECDTNNANTNADEVLLTPAGVVQREGDPVPAPAGASLGSFDGLSAPAAGQMAQNIFLTGTTGGSDDSGVYWNGNLTIQEGFISTSPSFSPNTPYIGFFEVKSSGQNEILIIASIDDPAIASTVDRALVVATVNGGGALLSETVLFKEGDVLPGQIDLVADFGTGPHNFAFNFNGDAMFIADLNGLTTTDGVVYLNNTLIAQEGSASPIAGRNWLTLSSTRVGLNASGQWIHTGTLDGATTSDLVIMSSSGKVAQEGDPVPGLPLFSFTGFGSGAVMIADNGDVFWFGEWNDVPTQNSGWFKNQTLIVQEGVSLCAGELITGLASIQDNACISPSGGELLFEGTLQTSGNAALLYDEFTDPVAYCTGKINSAGCVPSIGSTGTMSATANSGFVLSATNELNNKVGLVLYSEFGRDASPFGPGGILCVKAPTRRSKGFNSGGSPPPAIDCTGVFAIDFNTFGRGLLGAPPNPAPYLSVPGQVVTAQFWGRDPGIAAPNNFSLSNGLEFSVGP